MRAKKTKLKIKEFDLDAAENAPGSGSNGEAGSLKGSDSPIHIDAGKADPHHILI